MPVKELAKVIGVLCFATLVTPGGNVFMRRLYGWFQGIVVDWKRGVVVATRPRDEVKLAQDFWMDLRWWKDHLSSRCWTPMWSNTEVRFALCSASRY